MEDLKDVALELADLLIEEGFDCHQIYHNAEDAMTFLPKSQVDIVIVDIGLPRKSGIDAIKHLRNICPKTQFCMFTVFEDDDKIFKSLEAGAKGYILKGTDSAKIAENIRELHQGGSPMSPTIARRILEVFRPPSSPDTSNNLDLLTQRELELLSLLSKGLLYKEISEQLHITIGTVKQHFNHIYEKLQVQNRTEAINLFRGDNT